MGALVLTMIMCDTYPHAALHTPRHAGVTGAHLRALKDRADRHRLLADPTRLAIVEALAEGPREIGELARVTGVHRNTVRAHLLRLDEAGFLTVENGQPSGPGRPSRRYHLREPLGSTGSELRLLVEGLAGALSRTQGPQAAAAAEEEGRRLGRQLGRRLEYPSVEQAVGQVMAMLDHLSFGPRLRRRPDAFEVELGHCAFAQAPEDPGAPVVCAFHLGLVRGVAEESGCRLGRIRMLPFVPSGGCRAEIDVPGRRQPASSAGAGGTRGPVNR
jgi:predicted ArsR family transcriptional regulator